MLSNLNVTDTEFGCTCTKRKSLIKHCNKLKHANSTCTMANLKNCKFRQLLLDYPNGVKVLPPGEEHAKRPLVLRLPHSASRFFHQCPHVPKEQYIKRLHCRSALEAPACPPTERALEVCGSRFFLQCRFVLKALCSQAYCTGAGWVPSVSSPSPSRTKVKKTVIVLLL